MDPPHMIMLRKHMTIKHNTNLALYSQETCLTFAIFKKRVCPKQISRYLVIFFRHTFMMQHVTNNFKMKQEKRKDMDN